jgi:hypothetical protein
MKKQVFKILSSSLLCSMLLVQSLVFAQVPNYVPTNGLVGWWPFNGNAVDESFNTNDGTLNGATLTTDRFGNANSAYNFDGINDFVTINHTPNLNLFPVTISLWCNGNSQYGVLLSKYTSCSSDNGLQLHTIEGKISTYSYNFLGGAYLNCDGEGNSNAVISDNNWYNVVATYDLSGVKIYLNNVLVISKSYSGNGNMSAPTNTQNLYFGTEINSVNCSPFNTFYSGKIDDIGIWNRTLTECEIGDLYNAQLNSFSITGGSDQTICIGEQLTLSGSGGTTYSWDNEVQNGVAFAPNGNQTYTVTSTSVSGCVATDQVSVTVNSLPSVNAGADQTVCAGTAVTLSATGATTYSWNNNVSNDVAFTPSATTTYTVTGTNSTTGCSNTDQVTVNVNALPAVDAGEDFTICNGETIVLEGSGASTYNWDNNVVDGQDFTPSTTATYNVVGTDNNNCLNSDAVTVTVNEPTFSTLTENAIDSYTLNGQTYTQSGTYTQVLTNAAGCDSTITLNLTLNFTGILELDHEILVSPNPTWNTFIISSLIEQESSFSIFDAQGRIVVQGKLQGKETIVDLSHVCTGNYLLQLESGGKPIKLIKQ